MKLNLDKKLSKKHIGKNCNYYGRLKIYRSAKILSVSDDIVELTHDKLGKFTLKNDGWMTIDHDGKENLLYQEFDLTKSKFEEFMERLSK